jgi:hypothetical protein
MKVHPTKPTEVECTDTKGNIYIDAAADVFMRAGRNINGWAGNDVNVRAKDSVDLVASTKDVRIKAENNLQVLGGNSGYGGVLIESRSRDSTYDMNTEGEQTYTSGILFRANASNIVSWSKNVYLRTGGVEELATQVANDDPGYIPPGSIVFDSARGKSNVVFHAKRVSEFLAASGGTHDIYFGTQDNIESASKFSSNNTLLSGFLRVDTGLYVGGLIWADGQILAGKGQVIAADGCNPGKMDNDTKAKIEAAANEIRETIRQDINLGSQLYNNQLDSVFYLNGAAGNDSSIRSVRFAFRTVSDYGTQNFKLFEARWQQLAREAEFNLPAWQENAVTTINGESYPYPGKFTTANYYQQSLQLFDAGNYKDRAEQDGALSSAYATGTIAEPELKTLNDYTVTGSNS